MRRSKTVPHERLGGTTRKRKQRGNDTEDRQQLTTAATVMEGRAKRRKTGSGAATASKREVSTRTPTALTQHNTEAAGTTTTGAKATLKQPESGVGLRQGLAEMAAAMKQLGGAPGAFQVKKTKWVGRILSEATKNEVRRYLGRRLARWGKVTQGNVNQLLRCETLRTVIGMKERFGDITWAWLAEMQRQGQVSKKIYRPMPGASRARAQWQEISEARAGWTVEARREIQPGAVRELELLNMVHQKFADAAQRTLVEGQDEGPIWVEAHHRAEVQNALRNISELKGPGGGEKLWELTGVLCIQQKIEGCLGRAHREGEWWRRAQALQVELERGSQAVQLGCFSPEKPKKHGEVVEVCLGWMAGAQSERKAAEAMGWEYVGLDRRGEVWSAVEKCFVQNIVMDLTKESFTKVWERVEVEIKLRYGAGVKVRVVWIVAGCCCRTFSKMDSVNMKNGNNFRVHTKGGCKPPVTGTAKGREAAAADKMVQRTFKFLRWAERKAERQGWGMGWVVENPVGLLWQRDYMQQWNKQANLQEVHLCAYRHIYKKPTHIWTNVRSWKPQGCHEQGNGKCMGAKGCEMGKVGPKGHWRHHYALGVASQKAWSGKGRSEMKQAIPHALHQELMMAGRQEKANKHTARTK